MIITLTLNPAMDKVLILDSFQFNVTNRIREVVDCVGGKGTHVSVNLSLLGVASIATGIVRGETGEKIVRAMRACPGVDARFLAVDGGSSRTNYALVENRNCTLVAEKGDQLTEAELARFLAHAEALIGPGDLVVLSGDASNAAGTGFQSKLIDAIERRGARFCLDANGGDLADGIRRGPLLIKPNIDELSGLLGRPVEGESQVCDAMRALTGHGIRYILVSCGRSGSYLLADGALYRADVPEVPVVNTVGCGDALVAGFLAGLEKGLPLPDCLRFANAVGSAASLAHATVGFSPDDVQGLLDRVTVKTLTTITSEAVEKCR